MPTGRVKKIRSSNVGFAIETDMTGLRALTKGLKLAPKEVQHEFRTKWRAAAQLVADDAKERASWSTKIPGSIKVRGTGANIKVIAGGERAPNAVPFEVGNRDGGAINRHPVFERENQIRNPTRYQKWRIQKGHLKGVTFVDQPTRPYLAPALDAHRKEVEKMMEEAILGAVNTSIGEDK